MKVILVALAAAALCAGPAIAQGPHYAHHPGGAVTTMDMSKMTPEQQHRHCSMVMGGKMQGAPRHDHSADKLGHAPAHKAPTEAKMKAMHEECAAIMAKQKGPAPAKP